MKAQIVKHTKDTQGCDFEEWNRATKEMKKCGCDSVATVGKNHICVEHLPHILLCTPNLDMEDAPRKGFKHGDVIQYKEDFLKIARGESISSF